MNVGVKQYLSHSFQFNETETALRSKLLKQVTSDLSFILFLTGNPQDINYTITELKTGRRQGIKIYPKQLWLPARKL